MREISSESGNVAIDAYNWRKLTCSLLCSIVPIRCLVTKEYDGLTNASNDKRSGTLKLRATPSFFTCRPDTLSTAPHNNTAQEIFRRSEDYPASRNESLLERMVETGAGSGHQGEFEVRTNRGINRFTRNILSDGKRADTLHSAVGFAYEACGRLNRSATHRDIIKRMNPGEIVMDGRTTQKDGKFS